MAARWLREGGAWGERESEGEQEVGRERGMKEGVVRYLQHIPWSGRTQCLPANVCRWASFLYRTPSLLIIIYPWFNIGHTHTHTNRHTREHIHTQCSSFSLHPPTPPYALNLFYFHNRHGHCPTFSWFRNSHKSRAQGLWTVFLYAGTRAHIQTGGTPLRTGLNTQT